MRKPKHPMQPPVVDDNGTIRFRQNAIVRYLIDICTENKTCTMNTLAILPFDREDREQFAQLIGYSVSGAGDLSYMSEKLIAKADKASEKLHEHANKAREARKAKEARRTV